MEAVSVADPRQDQPCPRAKNLTFAIFSQRIGARRGCPLPKPHRNWRSRIRLWRVFRVDLFRVFQRGIFLTSEPAPACSAVARTMVANCTALIGAIVQRYALCIFVSGERQTTPPFIIILNRSIRYFVPLVSSNGDVNAVKARLLQPTIPDSGG